MSVCESCLQICDSERVSDLFSSILFRVILRRGKIVENRPRLSGRPASGVFRSGKTCAKFCEFGQSFEGGKCLWCCEINRKSKLSVCVDILRFLRVYDSSSFITMLQHYHYIVRLISSHWSSQLSNRLLKKYPNIVNLKTFLYWPN